MQVYIIVEKWLENRKMSGQLLKPAMTFCHTSYKYTSHYLVRVEKRSGDSAEQRVDITDPVNTQNNPNRHRVQLL